MKSDRVSTGDVNVPTRVAFCITELDPGGAERALFEIVTRLDRQVWEPRVYCLGPETDLAREFMDQGIPTHCLGARRIWQMGSVLWRLTRELRAFQPALLQTFLFHANLVGRLAGWWAGVSCRVSGIRVAEHGSRWHTWLDRWTQGLVRWHICVSEGVRQFAIQAGLPEERLCVIPNGVDHQRFANAVPVDLSAFGIPTGAWTVVTVGRLSEQKGHADLIRALAPLMEQDRSWHLLIVGEGPLRADLIQLSEKLGQGGQVHLPGRQENVAGILKAAQTFALPSHWEGMPNALLEALAAGLPCVATDVEGVHELLYGRGRIVAPGDIAALTESLAGQRFDSLTVGLLKSQGIAVNGYTWRDVSLAYADLYTQTITERGSRPVG